jgi:hypothetical protein
MKDNIKLKLIDAILAGHDIHLSYDRHGYMVIYNSTAQYDRVIFSWSSWKSRSLQSTHKLTLKEALDFVDAHWDCRRLAREEA